MGPTVEVNQMDGNSHSILMLDRVLFLRFKQNRSVVSSYCLNRLQRLDIIGGKGKGKGKTIPLQAWTVPEGSRWLKSPDFKTIGT